MAFPDKPIAHLLGSNGAVHAVTYSASPGTYILTGSSDRSIRLYNPQPNTSIYPSSSNSSYITAKIPSSPPSIPEGRLIQTYSAHGYEVLSLTVSSDNARFASSGGDRTVFLWDVTTAKTIRRFGGNAQSHSARINAVALAGEDDSLIVSGSLDASVRLWDCKSTSFKPVQVLTEARDAISAVVVRGPEILAGSVDGRVRSYDVRMGRCVTDVQGPSVTSLCLTKDGKAVLVGSLDSKVRLMDRESGGCLKTYADPGRKNEDLRMQAILGGKDQYVLAGDEMNGKPEQNGDGKLWAWDVVTGEVKAKVNVPWGPAGAETRKKLIGKDGKEKERNNVVSCMAWREHGFGDQYCVGGTSGAVTVFGYQ
ncbi:WD40-repeat-containing domain protein [Pseudomassariella vexata]|uniref:WD40-repeat-containing domain protein n=1 Tax=Pseudomassariella vexata TaxID=1141098 RepID=A0A1Y2EJD0_9PEZI|nr:WD40-repeat-containing domain protein [Pseudomassariella vexata]ORY71669.1 WD40-repeat-containing domain protein [Pseudomassariella vexata]